jgi:chromosome segregation ATPase
MIMEFLQWVLETFGLAGLFTLGLFLMSRNQSKILPQAIATTSQVVSGIEGLRADLREDRQTLSNHNEQSIQHHGALLQGFDQIGRNIDANTQAWEKAVAALADVLRENKKLEETLGGLSGTMNEVKTTMDKLNDIPTLLAEIRDALRSVESKIDRLLAEGEAVKTEAQEIKQRVEAVETALKAQGEPVKSQEIKSDPPN